MNLRIRLRIWDLNDSYICYLSEEANWINNEFILSSDFMDLEKIIDESPADKTIK